MSLEIARRCIPDATAFQIVSLDEITADPLRTGLEYWQSKRGTRRFPARADINPGDIRSALQNMSLVKVAGTDLVYKIVGDAIVRAYDVPLQNRYLSDIIYDEPGFGTIVIPLLKRVVQTGEALAVRGTTGRDVSRANFTDYQNVLLPLGPNDATVDHVITFSSYMSRPFIPAVA